MADKVLRLVVGLFVGIYVARYLGPENFGILSFAMSFVAIFSAFAKLGLDGIVVRNMVNAPESRDYLLGTVFTLKIIGSFLLIGFVYFSLQLANSSPLIQAIVLIIAFGQIFHAFEVIEFYFQSQVQGRQASFAGIISLLISSIVKLALIWSGASLVWFAVTVVIEAAVKALVLSMLFDRGQTAMKSWRFSLENAKLLLKDCWPLILSGLVIMIYMRIDQVMIKMMLDNRAVGNYAVAVRLSEAWYFIPMVITQSLFPAILNAKKQSEEFYYQGLQNLYDYMVWFAVAVAIPTTFLGDWIVYLLFGQEYSQAGGVLAIHIWAGIFVALGVANGKWFLAENLQTISTVNTMIGAIINVILNLVLLPTLGIIGAALATVVSYAFAAYFCLLLSKKTRKVFFNLSKSFNFFRSLKQI